MIQLPKDGSQTNLPHPSCGVVVEKNEEGEKICGIPGTHLVYMVDPETRSRVTAILVVCDRHNDALDNEEELIFLSDNGEDHILVSYKEDTNVTEPNGTDSTT